MNLFQKARWLAGAMWDVAFPSRCVSCGDAIEDSPLTHVCDRCYPKIHIVEDPRCLTCGYPFFGDADSHSHCPHCEPLNPHFSRGWSIGLFRGPVRDLIYALKYRNGLWAVDDLGKLAELAEGLSDFLADACLTPVPLHPRKERERGYNQSSLIAAEIARRFVGVEVDLLLERVIDTPSQTRFNRQERYRNLRNAFSLSKKRAIDPGKRYILLDDVFTTGSTLNACAAALRKAGAKRIDVLTMGHG